MGQKAGKNIEKARAAVEDASVLAAGRGVLLQKIKFAKFDETVDLTLRLGVDPKHADQMVRGTVVLPHGLGKSKKVLVIASGEKCAKPKPPAPTLSAAKTWWRRSRRKAGPITTP